MSVLSPCFHGGMAIAFFISAIMGSVLAGISREQLDPPNEVMFWVGVGFLILSAFILLNWIIFTFVINFSNNNLCYSIGHWINFNLGLIMMIIGAAFMANEQVNYDVYHWVGLGLSVAWPVFWLIGFELIFFACAV